MVQMLYISVVALLVQELFANNFDNNELVKAIEYAKLRGVKTHLTLNTLLKNSELKRCITTC